MPWFLNSLVSSVAHRSGKEISALDNTFALIDEYICADLSIRLQLFPCSPAADHTFREQWVAGPFGIFSKGGPRSRFHLRDSLVDLYAVPTASDENAAVWQ